MIAAINRSKPEHKNHSSELSISYTEVEVEVEEIDSTSEPSPNNDSVCQLQEPLFDAILDDVAINTSEPEHKNYPLELMHTEVEVPKQIDSTSDGSNYTSADRETADAQHITS